MSQKRGATIYDFFKTTKKAKSVQTPELPLSHVRKTDSTSSELRVPNDANTTSPHSKEPKEATGRSSQLENSAVDANESSPVSPQMTIPQKMTQLDYNAYCARYDFDKLSWIRGLNQEERDLLRTEINYLHISWLVFLHKELTKPYFLNLKRFLKQQGDLRKTVFPPENQIYSWSHLTPLPSVKCLILGQDPYHNHNQAHGLAFSVLEPTKPPPSLKNIYKTIAIDYPNFEDPTRSGSKSTGGGNLSKWAERGCLMLNACLTVEAHKANSHAKHGWEQFTEQVIKSAVDYHKNDGFVIMAWGLPAQQRVSKLNQDLLKFLVLKTVHPSPLSASRGFFSSRVFLRCNQWLEEHGKPKIDWGLVENNTVM